MAVLFAALLATVTLARFSVTASKEVSIEELRFLAEKRVIERAEFRTLDRLNIPYPSPNDDADPPQTPQYLLDLYDVVSRNVTRTKTGAERDAAKAQSSNIIEALIASSNATRPNVSTLPHERLRFETPDLRVDTLVYGAELRLHRDIAHASRVTPPSPFKVKLYQIVRLQTESESGFRSLIDVVDVNSTNDRDDWIVFDVTEAIRSWIAFRETNHGFELEVELSDSRIVHPSVIGLKNFAGDPNREAILVVFSGEDGDDVTEVDLLERVRRSIPDVTRQKRARDHPEQKTESSDTEDVNLKGECKLRSFYVDFREIGWKQILMPPGFYSNYCGGTCPRFLKSSMNSTNHAWLQNLVYWRGQEGVPPLACVPTDYGPITVMYKDQAGIFKFRKYHSLVARACGCR